LKYECDVVVKKFTFAISSPDEFLFVFVILSLQPLWLHCKYLSIRLSICLSACLSVCLSIHCSLHF